MATELTMQSKWIQAIAVGVFVTVLNQAREWAGIPHSLLTFLMTAVGGCLIVIWVMISLSYMRLRDRLSGDDIARAPSWLAPVTLVALVGIVALMLFDASARNQILAVLALSAVLVGISALTRRA